MPIALYHTDKDYLCVCARTHTRTHTLVLERVQRKDTAGTRVKSNNVSEGQHHFIKSLKIVYTFNPVIFLLKVYPQKRIIFGQNMYINITITLFIMLINLKQPKYPTIREWQNIVMKH